MTESIVYCPNCNQPVDEAFYYKHVTDQEHKIGVINIKGVGPQLIQKAPTPMLDIPYLGRVTRIGFFAWSITMLILGVLMAAYAWRII